MLRKLFVCLFISSGLAVDPNLDCPGVIFVTRDEWGSLVPKLSDEFSETPKHAFIHHTEAESCSSYDSCKEFVRNLQIYDMDVLGRKDIGMSFLVGGDARVYEGRGWSVVGDHTPGYPESIGISFIGNYDNGLPTPSMLKAARSLLNCGVKKGLLHGDHSVNGHRDVSCSHCPGDALQGEISSWEKFEMHPPTYKECWEKK